MLCYISETIGNVIKKTHEIRKSDSLTMNWNDGMSLRHRIGFNPVTILPRQRKKKHGTNGNGKFLIEMKRKRNE